MRSGSRQRGQSMVEYLVVALFACIVLAVGNPSPIESFLNAVQVFYANFTYAISLP